MTLKTTILVGLVCLSGLTGFAATTNQIDSAYQNQRFTTNLFASVPDMPATTVEMSALGFIKALHYGSFTNLVSFLSPANIANACEVNEATNVTQLIQMMAEEFIEERARDSHLNYSISNAVLVVNGNTAKLTCCYLSHFNGGLKIEPFGIDLVLTNGVWLVDEWE